MLKFFSFLTTLMLMTQSHLAPDLFKFSLHRVVLSMIDMIFNVPSIVWYKIHQIPKLKFFLPHLAVVFVHCIEARCYVENEHVVGSSAERQCSNYFWVLNNFVAYQGALILKVWWYSKLIWVPCGLGGAASIKTTHCCLIVKQQIFIKILTMDTP